MQNRIVDFLESDKLKAQITQTGNEILAQTKQYTSYSGVTSAHVLSQGASIGGNVVKEGVKSVHQIADSTTSYTLSTINRYTPDLYDVGHNGQGDLTSEMASFAVGNTAMVAQNSVRLARIPVSAVINGASSVVYSKNRMEQIKASSENYMEHSPLAKMRYVEIATGHSQKDIVLNKDRYAWNRFEKNEIHNLNWKQRGNLAYTRFKGNRYNRMLGRKQGMEDYSKYLRKKSFSLKRSIRGTVVNQSRKLTNQVIRGNDPNSMTNQTMWYANKGIRIGTRAGAKATRMMWQQRIYFRRFGSAIMHPIRTIKHLITALISIITSFGTIISTIPVVVSFIAALLPIIVVCICVVSILTSLFAWHLESNDFNFSEIKLCDLGNSVKSLANVSAITSKTSEQYKLLFEDKYGKVEYDDWGLAYIKDEGERWYCNAIGTYFGGAIGDKFRVTLESGEKIHIILCDIKADKDTHAGNNDPSPTCLTADGSLLEFYGEVDNVTIPKLHAHGFGASVNYNLDSKHKWKGAVTKIERAVPKKGNISGGPNFNNSKAWQSPNNPYSCKGQCTWFAWGRFYEIYGFDPGFRGNGNQCVSQLLSHHPDKFIMGTIPKAGAVFSGIGVNHVGIVVGSDGVNVTIQDGNYGTDQPGMNYAEACDSWEYAKKDWRTRTMPLSQLRAELSGVVFANPK